MKTEEKYTKHYFKRLSFEIGNRFDGIQFIEIINKNDKLFIEYSPRKNSSGILFSRKINEKYELFFKDLVKINIENWDNDYQNKLYSGHHWNLKLYFRQSIIIEKQGSNNYPNNFGELISFIKKYYLEFTVDINTRKTLNENDLLKLYCSEFSGTSFSEVSIGDKIIFGNNSTDRRLDIVRFRNDVYKWFFKYNSKKEHFKNILSADYEIEIVEIKTKLNRTVIGQIIVGEYMFKRKFNINNVTKAILYHEGDDALELFCNENNIKLIKY
jgi:hypothetical protein